MRNRRFDEAKGLLSLLVVLGHLVETQVPSSMPTRLLYEWIYFFHMPTFVFVSGYLFKIGEGTKDHFERILRSILVPLFIFEAFYETCSVLMNGTLSVHALGLSPYWALWYLLSLATWSMLMPLVAELKPAIALPAVLAVALAAGCTSYVGMQFALSRTLCFFPYFLLGHLASSRELFGVELQASLRSRLVAAAVFLALGAGVVLSPPIDIAALYCSSGYPRSVLVDRAPLLFRALCLAIGMLASMSFVWAFPLGSKTLARWGENSLAIYLVHGLAVRILFRVGFVRVVYSWGELAGLGMCLIVSLLLCFLLGGPGLSAWLKRLSGAVATALLKSRETRPLLSYSAHHKR